MAQAGGAFQVVFRGMPANATDNQKAGIIVKLTASFHMSAGDALRFLQLRNFVLHKHLEQHEAAAMAARFQAIGLDVTATAMSPATGPLTKRGTTHLTEQPFVAPAAARPQPASPPAAAADEANTGIVICPECHSRVRVKDPANVRCAMCSASIPMLNVS